MKHKLFNKQEIVDLGGQSINVLSYLRGYYQPLFKADERFVKAQKLACLVILKAGFDPSHEIAILARDTFSRMTKQSQQPTKGESILDYAKRIKQEKTNDIRRPN